jgi:molybdopterin molybdotransferase
VFFESIPTHGQWIRKAGEDIQLNQVILEAGHRLIPADVGLLASLGIAKIAVSRKPKVALFSTGNELVMPGSLPPNELPSGRIFNSNLFILNLLLRRSGAVVTNMGTIPDQFESTRLAFQQTSFQHDLILTSGGVSVGEEDHVKPAVEALGSLKLWALSMKPGKPFAFGQIQLIEPNKSAFFMGLPGNPVSSFVTFMLLVRPFLAALQGKTDDQPWRIPAKANFSWLKPDQRREFIRVKLNPQGELDLFPNQGSGVLTSLSWADGVVDVPSGHVISPGDVVQFIPWQFN